MKAAARVAGFISIILGCIVLFATACIALGIV